MTPKQREAWFRKQFGGHPDDQRSLFDIKDDIEMTEYALARLRQEYTRADFIIGQHLAMLYTVQAFGIKPHAKENNDEPNSD